MLLVKTICEHSVIWSESPQPVEGGAGRDAQATAELVAVKQAPSAEVNLGRRSKAKGSPFSVARWMQVGWKGHPQPRLGHTFAC